MKNKAFTLVEMSIVLVIISIIITVILTSSNLIKTSTYRKIISDYNYYYAAVNNFNSRYNALPGDIVNTSQYEWKNINNVAAVDGNNNGKIGIGDNSDAFGESIQAWLHLSASGLITGNYTGQTNGTPAYSYYINTPPTASNNAFYSLYYINSATGMYGKKQNAFIVASINTASIPWANSVLSPSDAYQIDVKADDGSPYTGIIYTVRGEENTGVSKCVTNDYTSSSSSYLFSDGTISCRLIFWLK